MTPTHRTPAWTFADQASTYRFWALIFAGVIVAFGAVALRWYLTWLPQKNPVLRGAQDSLFISWWMAGNLFGLLVGLLLTQSKSARGYFLMPLVAGALGVGAAMLETGYGVWLPYAAVFWAQATTMALAVVVPSAIGGGTFGRASFGCALAILTLLQMTSNTYAGFATLMLANHYGAQFAAFAGCAAMFLAAALLAPIGRHLFDGAPRSRHRPLPPVTREGMTVGFIGSLPWLALAAFAGVVSTSPVRSSSLSMLALVAFAVVVLGVVYSTYWFYRIHGEVASRFPSPQLFTPRGALWMYLLVPLGGPLLLLTLGRTLREAAAQAGTSVQRSSAWFNVWSVFLPPIAMGMVQAQLNEIVNPHGSADVVDRHSI
ncbi:hypothetical protein ACSEQ4_23025 [Pseudomonas aeruginosa]